MRRSRWLVSAGIAVVGLLVVSAASALGPRVPDPIPALIGNSNITVALEKVADGFVNPVGGYTAPGDNDSLYVVEERGLIWRVDLDDDEHQGGQSKRLFADLTSIVIPLGCFFINYDERGLFGVAFHPDYKRNGLVYTYTNETPLGQPTLPPNQCNARTPDHDNVVREWRVTNHRDEEKAVLNTSSSRELLRVSHPQFNHNGGELRFGADGKLYVSLGDGGAADDQGAGHNPTIGNAQDLSSLLGKLLRIDPRPSGALPYTIPADNPFVGVAGARPEIWAHGFRNPYKFSFDRRGTLYLADVGQNDIEEVSIIVKGGNYGWRVKEGSFAFDPNGAAPGFVTADVISGPYIDPIIQYDHCLGPVPANHVGPCPRLEGVTVVGGFVYRGHEVRALRNKYVFGDYSRSFFSSDGRLFIAAAGGGPVTELNIAGRTKLGMSVLGFAEDREGEIYVMGKTGAVPGNTGITDPTNTTGAVYRIVEADDDD